MRAYFLRTHREQLLAALQKNRIDILRRLESFLDVTKPAWLCLLEQVRESGTEADSQNDTPGQRKSDKAAAELEVC